MSHDELTITRVEFVFRIYWSTAWSIRFYLGHRIWYTTIVPGMLRGGNHLRVEITVYSSVLFFDLDYICHITCFICDKGMVLFHITEYNIHLLILTYNILILHQPQIHNTVHLPEKKNMLAYYCLPIINAKQTNM